MATSRRTTKTTDTEATEPTGAPVEEPTAAPAPAVETPAPVDTRPRNVVEAIVAVMREVRSVGKDEKNEFSNYNFRGIDSTVNALGPIMRKFGLLCVPTGVIDSRYAEIEAGKGRTKQGHMVLAMGYTFYYSNPAGEISQLKVEVAGEAMDSGDKATPKAMSVAYRTCLLQSFTLPTQERDPDSDTFERSAPASAQEVHEALLEAAKAADPHAAVLDTANRFGRPVLERVQIPGKGGALIPAAQWVDQMIGYLQNQAAEAARAEQDAVEGETRDVNEDARADAQPQDDARAQAEADARAEQDRVVAQPGAQETSKQTLYRLISQEVAELQAPVMGQNPDAYVRPFLDEVRVEHWSAESISPHLTRAMQFVMAQRPQVIAKMRERGDETRAAAYEAKGSIPGPVADLLGERVNA